MTEPESVARTGTHSPRAESVASQDSREEKDQTNNHLNQSSGEATGNVQDNASTKNLSWIDRLLVVWILIAMAVGLILGNFVPNTKDALARGQFVGVSIPILVGLLVMMYPILCRVRYESIHKIFSERQLWEQMSFSFVVNWMIAPFVMLALAWAFLPDNSGLREGLIMVGIARCIAMVLIWTDLSNGDNEYCAVLVAFNSVLQIVLFAPYSIIFIKVISKDDDVAMISYSLVAKSVAVFLGIPFGAAIITRFTLRAVSEDAFNVYLRIISPFSLLGLIYTIIVLFAAQGSSVVANITSVLRVIPPLVVYFAIMFFATWYVCRIFKWQYELGCAQSFTAASNNFELAIAVAVATFGIDSKQALATTVGPLIEVPVLATLVHFANWMHRRDLTRPHGSIVSG